jgi:hypothetical protein
LENHLRVFNFIKSRARSGAKQSHNSGKQSHFLLSRSSSICLDSEQLSPNPLRPEISQSCKIGFQYNKKMANAEINYRKFRAAASLRLLNIRIGIYARRSSPFSIELIDFPLVRVDS